MAERPWCGMTSSAVLRLCLQGQSVGMSVSNALNLFDAGIITSTVGITKVFTGAQVKHYPDFFAVLQSGRKILIDVKPHGHMNEAVQDQFAKTAAACQTARLRSPDTDAQRCVAHTAGT